MRRRLIVFVALFLLSITAIAACNGASSSSGTNSSSPAASASAQSKIGVVLDTGGENDKSFNEYTLKGARDGATAAGLQVSYIVSTASSDYEKNIETQISEGANLVITVGFLMGDATAAIAKRYPETKFAIIDYVYPPGKDGADPYKGTLKNVTSLVFAEDQVGYLTGVLAACVSKSGTIATVSGMEIPPVQRYVKGFQTGAKSLNPQIKTLNQYVPDFNDPATGKSVGQSFISQGADVIFAVGGNTGNGGLLAAKEANIKAIGVDVDQYFTYPEVKDALLTSAKKNIDIATAQAIKDFAASKLQPGISTATIASGGVGLAPYHDWDSKISADCKAKVKAAEAAVKANPKITGATA